VTDDPPVSDLTLRDVLTAAAEDLAGVERIDAETGSSWTVDGRAFATLDEPAAEFRLDPMVALAALRTPDTATSTRGADWVRFAPATLDDGAVDRAEAWFLSAHRRATTGKRRT
jgi:hypothetical protein